jgi:hypothetical protein
MLIEGHQFNQKSRQEVLDTHTGFNLDMVVRRRAEKLEFQEVYLIYV